MPPKTAHAFASAFSKPIVECAPEPWSGRLDPDGLKRPGGLLIAALLQGAAERDLSLSELAAAMGVSYWSLSQLRIGFRPIEALDDDVAQASAAFLDLPPMTIQMLAGLLDPAEALASMPLTGEDIWHVRLLLDTEPADLVLLPPPNRSRPLQSLSVDELAVLHQEHGRNTSVCETVRAELACRPLSKTERLRAALGATAEAAAEPSPAAAPQPPILRCACCQKRLRIPLLDAPGEVRCPTCQTEYAVHWQATVCLVQRIEAPEAESNAEDSDEGDEGLDDGAADATPWAVLGLEEGSPWDAVERARRALLQQYHPDRLGHVSPLVQRLAEREFKRVSEAFETLRSQR
ncbi:MAG: J domain-containing protein [Hydrogenophaga sp.]|uniref:J domain-containing protein n=1 Tax=Hydrogenophaga sp. TaxID=1904254 RepID=UPI0025BFE643|nr:J domain-containing protein [Hydrogenophaga sp.]MBT9549688.1 J domain-containing protein [Hydrogenophaga sp.]